MIKTEYYSKVECIQDLRDNLEMLRASNDLWRNEADDVLGQIEDWVDEMEKSLVNK